MEDETGQEGREVRGDEAAAETRNDPSETRDKPEVEPGQGAVAGPDRKDRVSVTFEGISTLGERIVSLSYHLVDQFVLMRLTWASTPRVGDDTNA